MFATSSRAFIDPRPRFIRADLPGGAECASCGDDYPAARAALGYDVCVSCSTVQVRVANMAMHKQAATYTASRAVISENQYAPH